MRDYRNLIAWQKAHELTLTVYRLTRDFPRDERFGLSAQLRRASASIATNIAEGSGRSTNADFARFLAIAAGSASEVQYQLELARDLGFSSTTAGKAYALSHEVKRLLHGLISNPGRIS